LSDIPKEGISTQLMHLIFIFVDEGADEVKKSEQGSGPGSN